MLFIICFPTIVDSFYILLEIMEYIYILYNPFEYLWIDFSVLNRGVIGILRCRAGQGAWSWRTPWPPQGSQSSWRWAASKEREAKPYMVSQPKWRNYVNMSKSQPKTKGYTWSFSTARGTTRPAPFMVQWSFQLFPTGSILSLMS